MPLRTLISLSTILGPDVLARYNQFLAAQINGEAAPGASSSEAMEALERLAATTLPAGYGWEWSGLSYQERRTGGQAALTFALAIVFANLFLIGQYESWTLPLSVMLSVGRPHWARSPPSGPPRSRTASTSRSAWFC